MNRLGPEGPYRSILMPLVCRQEVRHWLFQIPVFTSAVGPGPSTGSWVIPRGLAERRREKAMKARRPHRYEEQEQKREAVGGKIHTHASEEEKREAHMSSLQTPHVFFYIWFRSASDPHVDGR